MLYLKPQYNRFKEVNNCRKQGILNQVVNQVQCSESVLVCEPGNPAGLKASWCSQPHKAGFYNNSWFSVHTHTHTHTTLNGKVRVYVCSYIGCLKIPVLKVMLSCLLSHSITHLMLHMHNTHVRMHTHAYMHEILMLHMHNTHVRMHTHACIHEISMNHTSLKMQC